MELPVSDVRAILADVVNACKQDPSKTADELLVATARARGLEPANYAYVAYAFKFYRGGMHSDWELMTGAGWERFSRVYVETDAPIPFGEINGKHSDVSCEWSQVDQTDVECGWANDTAAADVALVLLAHGAKCADGGRLLEKADEAAGYEGDSDAGSDIERAPINAVTDAAKMQLELGATLTASGSKRPVDDDDTATPGAKRIEHEDL